MQTMVAVYERMTQTWPPIHVVA